MRITSHGHSCFTIESDGYSLILDPYSDNTVPGLSPLRLKADAVLCSHDHFDHNYKEAVELSGRSCPFKITEISTFHDESGGSERGCNTIHIIEHSGLRIAHLGDLGHPLSSIQLRALSGLNAIMIPVGGFYTIDAATAKKTADAIGATVVIPMHYRYGKHGFDVIGTLDDYLALCNDVVYAGSSIEITNDTKKQTAVVDVDG
jgi:L-ascorbate metabolism protein UlaG (beta-lactamase superfamily)